MAQARGAPGLSRTRLPALALAIPLLGIAALAVLVAVTHHSTPTPAPRPNAVVTPTAEPTPTEFPPLLTDADSFRLVAPHTFGTIATPTVTLPAGLTVDMIIATQPTGLPTALPVWLLAPPALDPRTVANRFGISPDATSVTENSVTTWAAGLHVDPTHGTVFWLAGGAPAPRLGGRPTDRNSAYFLAMGWLRHSGLMPFTDEVATIEQTSNGESASFPEWTITWRRTAPGYLLFPIDQVSARVSADGTLKELDLSRPRVARGALYTLRPWQDALRDAQQGHWYQVCCQPLPDFATPDTLHVTITSVSLRYAIVDTPQGMLTVPMYAFAESGGTYPGLVPAVAP